MANYTKTFSDTNYNDENVLVQVEGGGGAAEVSYTDSEAVSEAVSVYTGTQVTITLSEQAFISDTLESDVFSSNLCCPVAGSGRPHIALQYYDADLGGIWQTRHSFTFGAEAFRRSVWHPQPHERAKNDIRESGEVGEYPRQIQLWFAIVYKQALCEQSFTQFLIDYLWAWTRNGSSYMPHRIVLYPAGLGQVNRRGEPVDPIQVWIANTPEEALHPDPDFGERRGAYVGQIVFYSKLLNEAADGRNPTSTDWQYYIPWNDPFGT